MKYKFLFLDLDFTLLNNKRELSEVNKEAIKKATEKGVKVVICTGRSYMSAEKFIKALNLDYKGNFAVAYNGGLIYEPYNNNTIIEHKLKKEDCLEIVKELRKFKVATVLYTKDTLYIEEEREEIEEYCKMSALEPTKLNCFEEIIEKENIAKILIKSYDQEFLKEIDKHFRSSEISKKVTMFFSSHILYEFNPYEIDKGSAVVDLSKFTNEDISCFIACGDNFNDISMVKNAGLGVAVKNGVDEIRAAADYVTENTNDEDAIAEVIEKFILNEE